jgi:FAD/FMN-containing dehydrogenase
MEIIWRGSTGYEEARVKRVFNFRRPDRYPLAVVIAKRETDIVETVKLARDHRTRIAIRSGGHSFAVWSVRDDSILLDLTEYHGVEVDVESQIAYVSPSTKSDIDIELMHKYGLIFGGGHCPSVGLGGYLLQAGFGWNCKV